MDPLQSDKPRVLVLGDSILDWLLYDKRSEDADQSLAWTSPLSRDDWHYAAGFDARQCVAGSAAIHAMLSENKIPVAGNAFTGELMGSIFVLRKRANAGKDEKERTRTYIAEDPCDTWEPKSKSNSKMSIDRHQTWRAAVSLLNESNVEYREALKNAGNYRNEELNAVCLWDVERGSFLRNNTTTKEAWESQQEQLFEWYNDLCKEGVKPAIVIRTSDPGRFKHFLGKFDENGPTVVLVCALTQLDNGNLRGSGTWSDVWSQTYDYLNKKEDLFRSDDWKFHIVIPVYEDGVIWIGPGCWPIRNADRQARYLRSDTRPLGTLVAVPGAQPGLSEFEEHKRIVGAHTLLTYAIVEHLANNPSAANLLDPIKKGLMRARRLRSHGYCWPDDLTSVSVSGQRYYISFPREVWKKGHREATDLLLEFSSQHDWQHEQCAGPYEVKCHVDFPKNANPGPATSSLRLFNTMEKVISGEFVASPTNCRRVIEDFSQENYVEGKAEPEKINWINIKGQPCPLDSFARDELKSFSLRQRISMQFGEFAMADPAEAAPILDLAQRIRQHVLSNRYNSPEKGSVFNFALFGSPGSGKSFLAREIARSIDPNGEIFSHDSYDSEYNLSQFTDPRQLTDAFELIASKSLGGKVPLVLWDEFDSVIDGKRGGWLARFLMPMQDAHFFDGRERRPIGTAVFVFIGGTFPTTAEFRNWACRTTQDDRASDSVLLKARDFHSRLSTTLDMPRIVEEEECQDPPSESRCQIFRTTWDKSYAKLARAVLLREFFRRNSMVGKSVFLEGIEHELSRFLLAIPLRHGARSLQRIVEACLMNKPCKVGMLHLPPAHFLEEHIETENVRLDNRPTRGMTIDEMKEACRRNGNDV
jgi:hypothetical protein